jgi:hypothetical protein
MRASHLRTDLNSQPSLCHTDDKLTFEDVFENVNMHFNHSIKPQEQKALACPYLLYSSFPAPATLPTTIGPA